MNEEIIYRGDEYKEWEEDEYKSENLVEKNVRKVVSGISIGKLIVCVVEVCLARARRPFFSQTEALEAPPVPLNNDDQVPFSYQGSTTVS